MTKSRHILIRDHNQPRIWLQMELNNDIGDIAGLAVAEMDAVVDLLHGHRAVGRSSPAKQRFFPFRKMKTNLKLKGILASLPPVEWAAAYGTAGSLNLSVSPLAGSGALPQANTKPGAMVDFILAARDPMAWHRENARMNPNHYSWSGKLLLPLLQKRAAGIYYNTHAAVGSCVIKYGMVGIDTLVKVCFFFHL